MEALFSGRPSSGGDALLLQLTLEHASPIEALARLAAFHTGWPAGVRPFRTTYVGAGAQHFPPPDLVVSLVAALLMKAGRLFSQTREPLDDFYVAAFLLWGLTAIHPFEDGNGRSAIDLVQHTLMRRWSPGAPLFDRKARLDQRLQPVLNALDVANDGTPERHMSQLYGIVSRIEGATLASLEADPRFTTIAMVLAVSLATPEAKS